MMDKTPILITGSNRSGSTWVGNIIASNTAVDNIIEPFNLNRIQRFRIAKWDYWYPRIDPDSPEELKDPLRRLVHYYVHLGYGRVLMELFHTYEGHSFWPSLKKRLRRASKPLKLLKDPMAVFSVPWMVEEFGVRPVILIRHPAAYVLSIKEKDWWFDFDHMLDQPGFFAGELEPLKEEVVRYQQKDSPTIIENAALFWKICYCRVLEYKELFPQWYFVKHEDLSMRPLEEFKKLFNYLDMPLSSAVIAELERSTMANEAPSEFRRDSVRNATKWKELLTCYEQQQVWDVTKDVARHYYPTWI